MNVYQYLTALKNGKAINAHRLGVLLEEHGLKIEQLGEISFVKPGKYKIETVNHDVLSEWMAKFAASESRVDASRRSGDSHLHRTNTAYFIAKRLNGLHEDFVIKCGENITTDNAAYSLCVDSVVLIENSECYSRSYEFLANVGLRPNNRTIAIWSAGKSITHPNATALLTKFEQILYCPDYDLAGIEIFETLSRTLKEKITFVMPDNLVAYKEFCQKPKHQKHFTKALEKARLHGFTPMVDLLSSGMGVLEQEVLIEGPNED